MRRGTEAVITAPPRKRMGASHVGSNPTLSELSKYKDAIPTLLVSRLFICPWKAPWLWQYVLLYI